MNNIHITDKEPMLLKSKHGIHCSIATVCNLIMVACRNMDSLDRAQMLARDGHIGILEESLELIKGLSALSADLG